LRIKEFRNNAYCVDWHIIFLAPFFSFLIFRVTKYIKPNYRKVSVFQRQRTKRAIANVAIAKHVRNHKSHLFPCQWATPTPSKEWVHIFRGKIEFILVPSAFSKRASASTNMHTRRKLRQTKTNRQKWIYPDYVWPIDHKSNGVRRASLVAIHWRIYRNFFHREHHFAVVIALWSIV